MKEQWQTEYETAFKRANGKTATVADMGRGYYRIERERGEVSWRNYRKQEIVDMTANLERRIADEGEKA
jgi:hypothetical protein